MLGPAEGETAEATKEARGSEGGALGPREAVCLQPAPQRGPADPEASRRLRQTPVGGLQRLDDRPAFALGQRLRAIHRKEDSLSDLLWPHAQRRGPRAQRDESR